MKKEEKKTLHVFPMENSPYEYVIKVDSRGKKCRYKRLRTRDYSIPKIDIFKLYREGVNCWTHFSCGDRTVRQSSPGSASGRFL
jgi:hypothetical protein